MKRLLPLAVLAAVIVAGLMFVFGVGGKSRAPGLPNAEDIARAESLRPDDPELAELYEHSCINCHSIPEAEAPLTGRREAWAWRLDLRGMDGLVRSAQVGFYNMPARGHCFECSEAEFRDLIAFMAGEEL